MLVIYAEKRQSFQNDRSRTSRRTADHAEG